MKRRALLKLFLAPAVAAILQHLPLTAQGVSTALPTHVSLERVNLLLEEIYAPAIRDMLSEENVLVD